MDEVGEVRRTGNHEIRAGVQAPLYLVRLKIFCFTSMIPDCVQ